MRALISNDSITKTILCLALGAILADGGAYAQTLLFQPGNLAVLRLGDGGPDRCLPLNGGSVAKPYTNYAASDILGSRQTALYIDQYDPNGVDQTNATIHVAVPTNGASGLFVNGNAGTEGNLTRSGDRSVLAVTGYAGDLLSITTGQQTAPSNLSYDRGIGTVDAFGNYTGIYRGGGWYGIATGKTNPRGVATDGAGNFWGCGNGYGSLYFNATTTPNPIQFQNIALTSCSKVINNALYASVKSSESVSFYPAGIYSFVDFYNNPVPHPTAASFLHLEIPANTSHNNCIGFDINPHGNVAYLADATASASGGLSKYVKSGLSWTMAYHLAIPGYNGMGTGILTNPASTDVLVGCFSVTVDWSGTNPVVFATTGDTGFAGSPYYGNRVIRVNDTNTTTSGANIIVTTNMNILTTVVKPGTAGGVPLTNVVYKSVAFTPDLRPEITSNPSDWSTLEGSSVTFSVVASSPYSLNYQWLSNGTNLPGAAAATLSLGPLDPSYNNTTYQCVVSNSYGAVTSLVATLLVSSVPAPLTFGAVQDLTNAVGNSQSIAVNFTGGTDPKGSYQWYLNGKPLSEGPTGNGSTLSGTTNSTLIITQASTNDAGVYSLSATNLFGPASNAVANFYTIYSAPVLVQPPVALTTFIGKPATNSTSAYGLLLSEQWYKSRATFYSAFTTNTVVTTNGVQQSSSSKKGTSVALFNYVTNLIVDGASYAGTTTPTLAILNPQLSDAATNVFLGTISSTTNTTSVSTTNASQTIITNTTISVINATVVTNVVGSYSVVFSNPGGSLTSAPVALTVVAQPPHTFISYTNAGQPYTQNFNSLPIPGSSSAEGANPLHMAISMTNVPAMLTNGNPGTVANMSADVTYSVENPTDIGFPVIPSGAIGGLGLSNQMNGWYGWAQNALVFAATKGDQSQGAVVDDGGIYYGDGTPLTGITNRALGLIATTKTGPIAFGAALINKTTNTYSTINLSFTGELWRNNPTAQPLVFGYFIDPSGTNSTFHPDQWDSTNGITYIPSLNVTFPTSASTLIFDGTLASNQVSLAVSGLTISNWPPGAALWLIWQAQTLGSAQNLAIDDLSFAAGIVAAPAVTTQPASSITPFSATLNASVNPNTLATTCYFQYGTNTTYGSFTATNNLAAGLSAVSSPELLSGLLPGTTYHFQAVANNSLGTAVGTDATFTTAQVPPPQLRGLVLGASGFKFSFTNWPGLSYTVWSSTEVATPLSQWQNLGHPTESPAGQYQFTDPQAVTNSQLYYNVRQP